MCSFEMWRYFIKKLLLPHAYSVTGKNDSQERLCLSSLLSDSFATVKRFDIFLI